MLLGRHETDTATQLRSYATLSLYMLLLRPNASSGSTMDLVYDGSGNLANIDPWRSKKLHEFRTEQSVVFFARCRPTTTNKQQPRTKPQNSYAYSIRLSLFIIVYHCWSTFYIGFQLSDQELALQELAREEVRLEAQSCSFQHQKVWRRGNFSKIGNFPRVKFLGSAFACYFPCIFEGGGQIATSTVRTWRAGAKLGGWEVGSIWVSLVLRSGIRGRHSMVAPFLKLVSG